MPRASHEGAEKATPRWDELLKKGEEPVHQEGEGVSKKWEEPGKEETPKG